MSGKSFMYNTNTVSAVGFSTLVRLYFYIASEPWKHQVQKGIFHHKFIAVIVLKYLHSVFFNDNTLSSTGIVTWKLPNLSRLHWLFPGEPLKSGVTPVTIRYIHPPHHIDTKINTMVMNHCPGALLAIYLSVTKNGGRKTRRVLHLGENFAT